MEQVTLEEFLRKGKEMNDKNDPASCGVAVAVLRTGPDVQIQLAIADPAGGANHRISRYVVKGNELREG